MIHLPHTAQTILNHVTSEHIISFLYTFLIPFLFIIAAVDMGDEKDLWLQIRL
jgi:hypothetical protein